MVICKKQSVHPGEGKDTFMRHEMRKGITFFVVVFFLLLFAENRAFAGELYFDDSGNMVFWGYDKKATTDIRYHTVGWTIKRYDDAIDAYGQQVVNIAKTGYQYEIIDPDNPEYAYNVFVIESQLILDRIGDVSADWRNQLVCYGGYVYIDNIMTVIEYGEYQGGVDSDGTMYGESYNTYEGIRYARDWANGDTLATYFDLRVKYPYISIALPFYLEESVTDKSYDSTINGSFQLGAGTKDSSTYDVAKGIPSGENLYLLGQADEFCYHVDYQEVTGTAYIPVKVGTTYDLHWIDRFDQYHQEEVNVERWYYNVQTYTYTKIKDIKKYDLAEVKTSSDCFAEVMVTQSAGNGGIALIQYGETENHMESTRLLEVDGGSVSLYSTNHQRPEISEVNQSELADKAKSSLTVWSDKCSINNTVILSDASGVSCGKTLEDYKTIPQTDIYKTGITIYKQAQNIDYTATVILNYSAADKTTKTSSYTTNSVAVHTPICVSMSISGDKANNENITPSEKDIVLGDTFTVLLSAKGTHLDIQGYGERDYTGYMKNWYVKFPFSVSYGKKSYEKDTWIKMTSSMGVFRLLSDNCEGGGMVECRADAVNLLSDIEQTGNYTSVTQEMVNTDRSNYCVSDSVSVNVIGKIYGFWLENGGIKYKTGKKSLIQETLLFSEEFLPLAAPLKNRQDMVFRMSMYATGIGDEAGEFIDMDVSYSVWEERNGQVEKVFVDVYKVQNEQFTAADLEKLPEYISVEAQSSQTIKKNVYKYSWDIVLSDKLVVVEKGKDISDIDMLSEYILRDKDIVMNIDLYAAGEDGRKLSYENPLNELSGYCNMWKCEGFLVDKFEDMLLGCGDVLIFGTEGLLKNTSHVLGTH